MKKFTFLFVFAFLASLVLSSNAFGQIAQRGTATSATSTNTSLTIDKPTGVVSGDVMLVNITSNNGGTPSLSGWSSLGTGIFNGSNLRATVLYKVAGGSEPANYTFALGAGANDAVGTIVAFSGVDNASPIDATGTMGLSVAAGQTATAPGITTNSANAAVVMFGNQSDNRTYSSWTTTSPGNLTEIAEFLWTNGTQDMSVGAAWATKASAGATGDGTVTLQDNNDRWAAMLIALKASVPTPSATLSPSTSQNIAVGGSVNFTATANNYTGSGNYTYTWTAVGATIPGSNPNSIAASSDSKSLTFPSAGTYTVTVQIARGGGGPTLNTNTTTVNVFAAPASPNLWGIQGSNVVNFSVNGGIDFGPGPSVRFLQTVGTSSAALARTDKPTQANGYFYWLLNSGTNAGVVQVYGSDGSGGSQTLIGSLDVNGGSNNDLGFVRLGARADGVVFGLAGDGTTIYLFQFKPNGVTVNGSLPVADQLSVVDSDVTLAGGVSAATFFNGDICLAGDGNIVALANNSGTTQILIGAPNGATTTLTKKFDVLDNNGNAFGGSVNGIAFDLQGSLYVSTSGGLYYINKNTVNGPAGTINISLVWSGSGLTDLASNFFPTTIITPVKISDFTVTRQGSNAMLNWTTVTETNSDRFEIERSYDGVNFTVVGSKLAAGNSTDAVNYQYADPITVNSGNIYYRLNSVDKDAKSSYSKIVVLRLNGGIVKDFNVYPNPFSSDLKIQISSEKESAATIRISNAAGQLVVSRNVTIQKGENILVLSSELQTLKPGMHLMEIITEDGKVSQKIIKR